MYQLTVTHVDFLAHLVLKFQSFRYHGNNGQPGVIFNYTVKLPALGNPLCSARFSAISNISRFIANFACTNIK